MLESGLHETSFLPPCIIMRINLGRNKATQHLYLYRHAYVISSCKIPRAPGPWLLLFLILPSPTHTHLNCRPWSEQLVILVYFWLLFFNITDHVYTLARTFWFKNIHTCTKWRRKFAVSGYCRNILVALCTWQCTTPYSVPPCTGPLSQIVDQIRPQWGSIVWVSVLATWYYFKRGRATCMATCV